MVSRTAGGGVRLTRAVKRVSVTPKVRGRR